MNHRNLVILSDIHLAVTSQVGLFDADRQLSSFLLHLARQEPCRLIFAGDLFEFLSGQPERPLTTDLLDQQLASDTVERILASHAEIFAALAELSRAGFELTILAGNHDVELILPRVRQLIEQAVGSRVRWLVHGEALRETVGQAKILIEHGDLYDDWNRVDYGQLTVANRLATRGADAKTAFFSSPPGSDIVLRFVEPLREQHPWITWIKPEKEALLPILHFLLTPRERLRLITKAKALLPKITRVTIEGSWLRRFQPQGLVRGAGSTQPKYDLKSWIRDVERHQHRDAQEMDRTLLIEKLRKVASQNGFFDLQTLDQHPEILGKDIYPDADLVIHGHTHAAKSLQLATGQLYLNSGTWCPLLPLPDADASLDNWKSFVESLEQNLAQPASRFTYIHIGAEQEIARARLQEWSGGHEITLSEWSLIGPATWKEIK